MDQLRAFMQPEYLWLIAGVVMIILEFLLPGFVIIFFGMGAILVGIVCWLWTISFNAQLVLFMVLSVVLLLAMRRWLKNVFVGYTSAAKATGELSREFLGQKVVVTETINDGRRGKVEFHGTQWEAEAKEPIEKGTLVEIVGQEGILFKVAKIK